MRLYGENSASRPDIHARPRIAIAEARDSGFRLNRSTGRTPSAIHCQGGPPRDEMNVNATMPASEPATSAVYACNGGSSSNNLPSGVAVSATAAVTEAKIAEINRQPPKN